MGQQPRIDDRIVGILIIVCAVFFLIFFSVVSTGFFHTFFYAEDARFAIALHEYQNPTLTLFFLFFTYLGNWQTILAVELCLILFFIFIRDRRDITVFLLSVLVGEIVVTAFKTIASRARPADNFLAITGNTSFPSGHAMIAVLFYGLAAYMLVHTANSKLERRIVTVVAVAMIFLIGLSRLYLGVHYLSDVVGGFALGASMLLLFIVVFKSWYTRDIKK